MKNPKPKSPAVIPSSTFHLLKYTFGLVIIFILLSSLTIWVMQSGIKDEHSGAPVNPTTKTPQASRMKYANDPLAYSFQYPSDWTLGAEDPANVTLSKDFSENAVTRFISITVHRYALADLPKGYTDVSDWYQDLMARNSKAVTPNDGYYYGPGSDNPYKWYMYYELDTVRQAVVNRHRAAMSWNSAADLAYFTIPLNQYVYEIVVNPTKAAQDAAVQDLLSTFKFGDQVRTTSTCRPRPACLDTEPRCLMPETADMCPPKNIQ